MNNIKWVLRCSICEEESSYTEEEVRSKIEGTLLRCKCCGELGIDLICYLLTNYKFW